MAQGPPPGPGGAEVFAYRAGDLVLRGVAWPAGGPSRFDRALRAGWEDRLSRGLFRYRLGALQTRVLPGRVGFVAQLNPQRGSERRRPQDIRSVRQGFDPRQFSFREIRPEEVLFRLAGAGAGGVLVVINVSPLEFGHVLLVPEPALALPQVLTPEALGAGLEAVLLSAHPGFRVGFNSLGAFASVNHLHLHGFYLDWELLVETAPCKPLLPGRHFHLLQEGPAPAFLFYSQGRRTAELARSVCRLTDHLVRREVAHNLFVTRGAAPEGPLRSRARPGIRVLLWARRPCFGVKEEAAFNVALCELAGHLPVKTARDFEALTEASAIRAIQEHLLPPLQFAQLQQELVALLQEEPAPQ
ncbi:GDP-D-glucose phosphorylase 1 [Tiliqua scincoides]|uniref:GDP-D-glucose phosphorylase 1 n=1 Tax=Tiliqua scincoides TaxID=71010 RepID=UPI00346384C2